jgi:hypothetical protein
MAIASYLEKECEIWYGDKSIYAWVLIHIHNIHIHAYIPTYIYSYVHNYIHTRMSSLTSVWNNFKALFFGITYVEHGAACRPASVTKF